MVMFKRLLLIAVIVVIAVIVGRRLFVSEKAKIRKQLNALEYCITKPPEESKAQMLLKMERLQALLTNPLTINVPMYNLSEKFAPREVAQKAIAVRSNVNQLSVTFRDVSITLDGELQAQVQMTVSASAEQRTRYSDTVEVMCRLRKTDGKWRFSDFSQVDVLEQ